MKQIVKKTRKFSFIKANKIYYTIANGALRQIRVTKAEFITTCDTSGCCEFEYELAGVGKLVGRELPYIYNTAEDAIKGVGRINTFCSGVSLICYCEENNLISYTYKGSFMGGEYYINAFRWNGHKVVCSYGYGRVGVEVRVNMLNGDITITCEDGVYASALECEEDNKIVCIKF